MSLHLRASGPATAPSIVFLHGGGVSGWVWGPVVARLSDYHCLVPDLPEHGRSRGVGLFSIRDAARRVADVVREHAHGGRAHVVGLSIGGQVALELLGTEPTLIDQAVLSGTLLSPSEPPRPRRRRGPTVRDYLRATFTLLTPMRDNPLLIRGILRLSRIPRTYLAPYRADARLATVDGLMRVVTENFSYRPPLGLRSARVPTLVVVGEDEPPVLRQSARELAAALPDARAFVVPGVAHSWNLEAPDRFAATMRAWIEDRPLPSDLLPLGPVAAIHR